MASVNKVTISGFICKEPRVTNGTMFLVLHSEDTYTDKTGAEKIYNNYWDVVVKGKLYDLLANTFIGQHLLVIGKLKYKKNKAPQDRSKVPEIVLSSKDHEVHLMGGDKAPERYANYRPKNKTATSEDVKKSFANIMSQLPTDSTEGMDNTDIPF